VTLEADAPRSRPALGAAPGPIVATDSFAVAGRKAMWPHVERLLDREAALLDPTATDGLKRYRVATRRLRAAIRVFRDAWPKRSTRQLRAGLAELADAVGSVRDLDVRLEHLAAWAGEHGPEIAESIGPLREAWAAERSIGAERLARRIGTRRHARRMADLVAFVSAPAGGATADDGRTVPSRLAGDRAPSAVWTAYEWVRAYDPVVRETDDATLHQLRIATKRLRYTLEFLAPLLGPERAGLVEQLVALQDHLGALNDAVVGAAAVRSFLAAHDGPPAAADLDPATRAAIERYLADREQVAAELRGGFPARWRPIAGATFTRRLASAVAPRPSKSTGRTGPRRRGRDAAAAPA
jgi:triphosphatase